jgi:hypothetical protein
MISDKTHVIKLENVAIPEPSRMEILQGEERVKDGSNDRYSLDLLHMYSGSPAHSAIIDGKSSYIIGGGLVYANGAPMPEALNTKEPLAITIDKCVKDYEIYRRFCVEVLYNRLGQAVQYVHVPGYTIRTNLNRSKFWYAPRWTGEYNASGVEFLPAENYPKEADITTSKLFYFAGYTPADTTCYPAPSYIGGTRAILTDVAVNVFNLNNVKNHFSLSTLISFFRDGNVPEAEKRKMENHIKTNLAGEDGGKIMLEWVKAQGQEAKIQSLSPGDWDKAYVAVGDKAQSDIFIAHRVTSPMLFGVKTEGQLGGTTELELAYEIFKNNYIAPRRIELTAAFNDLFKGSALVTDVVEFKDVPLFSTTGVTQEIAESISTVNELRKKNNQPPVPWGDVPHSVLTPEYILSKMQPAPVSPALTPVTPERTEATETPTVEPKKDRAGWVRKQLSEDDFNQVADIGLSKSLFEVIRRGAPVKTRLSLNATLLHLSKADDIAQHIINSDIAGKSVDDLLTELDQVGLSTDATELRDIFSEMKAAGVADISIEDGKIKATPVTKQDAPDNTKKGDIVTMYDYIKRPGVPGETLIPTSRGFCRKLVEGDKYFSREDIQKMSSIFGYDVLEHGGGWWHNPETGESEEHCRHEFQLIRVRRVK